MESPSSSSSSSSSSTRSEEYRNWLELPRDVTASILQRLGAIEILESAQKVCLHWRNLCKDPSMWRAIDMRNHYDLDIEKMCRHAIDRSSGQLRDINIEFFGTDDLLNHITNRSLLYFLWICSLNFVINSQWFLIYLSHFGFWCNWNCSFLFISLANI